MMVCKIEGCSAEEKPMTYKELVEVHSLKCPPRIVKCPLECDTVVEEEQKEREAHIAICPNALM